MANPFGRVVDNHKLDEIERYIDEPKTQEDRAREAMKLINEDGKNDKAASYVDSLKYDYGNGITVLCLIYNATGDTLRYVADIDWFGYIGRTPYPTEIGNGQWAGFLHVHQAADTTGCEAAVVYRGKNKDGEDRDFMISWRSPWGAWYRNKVYTEVRPVDHFQSRWTNIYDKLENSDYSDVSHHDGAISEVDIAKGSSPVFHAILKIPFIP